MHYIHVPMLNLNRKVITFMLYASEGSLESFLQNRWLPEKQLTKFALHVARGMKYLERKGVIHRLKNLFCFNIFT